MIAHSWRRYLWVLHSGKRQSPKNQYTCILIQSPRPKISPCSMIPYLTSYLNQLETWWNTYNHIVNCWNKGSVNKATSWIFLWLNKVTHQIFNILTNIHPPNINPTPSLQIAQPTELAGMPILQKNILALGTLCLPNFVTRQCQAHLNSK